MQRRGFLLGILAAGAAPAVVRSGVLMPVRPAIIVPNGGKIFVAINKAYVDAASARISDMLFPSDDRAWVELVPSYNFKRVL